MIGRRHFLVGLSASATLPLPGWAGAGSPAFVTAGRDKAGRYLLAGIDGQGAVVFTHPLPGRGHAAAAHPHRSLVVAFARRPGTFAHVINCATGRMVAQIPAVEGRHFYGHGVFSGDGNRLYTTENHLETTNGVIGVWDTASYTRIGEFSTHGIGPHDVMLSPDGQTLIVANGGIETHPDSGRSKLNIPMMEPNLAYLGHDGTIQEIVTLPHTLHKNSIRHLAQRADGLVAFAMQWEGAGTEHPPLLGLHERGRAPRLLSAPHQPEMKGYAGSIAFSGTGAQVAITSPRGNVAHVFDVATGTLTHRVEATDICGLGKVRDGFAFTTGRGVVGQSKGQRNETLARHDIQWDNHLIPISAA